MALLPNNERTHTLSFFDPSTGEGVNLSDRVQPSQISFKWKLNGAPDSISIRTDIPYYETNILQGLNVQWSVVNPKYPDGKQIFVGIVEKVSFKVDGGKQISTLTCISEYSLFSKIFLRFLWKGSGQFYESDTLPIGEFIGNIVDEFNTNYPDRLYNKATIESVATIASYKGEVTTLSKSIQDIAGQADSGYFTLFDANRNVIFTNQSTIHFATLGEEVNFVDIGRDSAKIKNSVLIGYGPQAIPQVYSAESPASIAQYGRVEFFQQFEEKFDASAAQSYGDKTLDENDQPKITGTIQLNSRYNYEDIRPGDHIQVMNTKFGNNMFASPLKITALTYAEQSCKLTIEDESDDFVAELQRVIS